MARAFGHRGFTHSLLAVFGALTLFYLKVPDSWIVPADALRGPVLGYLSHILADMLTPAGAAAVAPVAGASGCRSCAAQGQSARTRLVALFVYAVWMPQTLADNSAIRWSSGVINSCRSPSIAFISHQSGDKAAENAIWL